MQMATTRKKPRRRTTGKKNPLLDQALMNAGLFDVFHALRRAQRLQELHSLLRCDVALWRWRAEVKRRGLMGRQALMVVSGLSIGDVAKKYGISCEKVLKNLMSCLEAYAAVGRAMKNSVDGSTISCLVSTP